MEVKANTIFNIALPVITLTGAIKVTGTIYVVIYDQVQGKVWSTTTGGQWEARATAALPTATLVTSGEQWYYSFAAAVTNGLADMTRLFVIFTDNLTPASITALSPTIEVTVRTALPAMIGDLMAANVTQIDGNATNDNLATLNLKKLNVVNNAGDAVVASSTGSNGRGIAVSGNGTGDGIKATGGATSGAGMALLGVGTGHGLSSTSGSGATGNAVQLNAASTNGHGLYAVATGTGDGASLQGGTTSGDGLRLTGGGVGSGLDAWSGSGASGDGIKASSSATNGNGLHVTGTGTGNGLLAAKGTTGYDLSAPAIHGALDGAVASVGAAVTVGGYATHQDPEYLLADDFGDLNTVIGAFESAAASAFSSLPNAVAAQTDIAEAIADIDEIVGLETPAGLREVTIHVQDTLGAPVEGMDVAIYDSTNTALRTRGATNSSGDLVVHRDDGTYKVRLAKSPYAIALGTLVVTADATVTFTATPCVPIGTATPGDCLVYGAARDASNTLVSGAVIDFYADAPQGVGDDVLTTDKVTVTTGPSTLHPTWTAGYFEVSLRRSSRIRVSSRLPKLEALIIDVPDAATSTLASLVRLVIA